jgi:hypothetical protein
MRSASAPVDRSNDSAIASTTPGARNRLPWTDHPSPAMCEA